MFDFLLFSVVIVGLYILFFGLGKKKKIVTSQDLLDYTEIYTDGFIELPGLRFRAVIEVEPINESLKSFRERQSLWLGFRNLIRSINIPFTFKVETRFLDLRQYIDDIKKSSDQKAVLLKSYGYELSEWLEKKSENKQNRDRRCYIILKIDSVVKGIEGGVKTGNPLVNKIILSLSGFQKSATSETELRKMAIDELRVISGVVMSTLEGMDIISKQLNKQEVLDMVYSTFNRDLAPYCQIEDGDREEMFSLFTTSYTPNIFLEGIEYGFLEEEENQRAYRG